MKVSKTKNITSKSDKLLHSGNLELNFFLSPECNSNEAQAVPGCGGTVMWQVWDGCQKIQIKNPKRDQSGRRSSYCMFDPQKMPLKMPF